MWPGTRAPAPPWEALGEAAGAEPTASGRPGQVPRGCAQKRPRDLEPPHPHSRCWAQGRAVVRARFLSKGRAQREEALVEMPMPGPLAAELVFIRGKGQSGALLSTVAGSCPPPHSPASGLCPCAHEAKTPAPLLQAPGPGRRSAPGLGARATSPGHPSSRWCLSVPIS